MNLSLAVVRTLSELAAGNLFAAAEVEAEGSRSVEVGFAGTEVVGGILSSVVVAFLSLVWARTRRTVGDPSVAAAAAVRRAWH